jgi:predicted dehydrogenase
VSLSQPVEVAVIGTGHRSRTIYQPLFSSLTPWVRVVAVCDPVREHAQAYAERMGVPAFTALEELIRARPMEAALVVTPYHANHSISCTLSRHGVHHLVETPIANMLVQAQEMVRIANEHAVVLRVAENFIRFPFDRIARKIAATGFLGPIGRITSYHDHVGFHNNSRWIALFGSYPTAVQAIEQPMTVAPHQEAAHRRWQSETFRARFFFFPDGGLVTDLAANVKGMLGRYPRPGYTEIDGTRGTIVQQATRSWHGSAEVRYCSDHALEHGAVADEIYPIEHVSEGNRWLSSRIDLPIGRVEHVNPYRPIDDPIDHGTLDRDYYGAAVMDHIVDFARAVRGDTPSEYTDRDAEMAMMMEVAARESSLRRGERLDLPLVDDVEAERRERAVLTERWGVDPLDVEAMLGISYPRQ